MTSRPRVRYTQRDGDSDSVVGGRDTEEVHVDVKGKDMDTMGGEWNPHNSRVDKRLGTDCRIHFLACRDAALHRNYRLFPRWDEKEKR